jgi:competence protein ComFC
MNQSIGYCLLCGKIEELEFGLCPYCDQIIKSEIFSSFNMDTCKICGNPLLHSDSICNHQERKLPANILKIGLYRSYLKELIIRYKFTPCRALCTYLASLITPLIRSQSCSTEVIWVVFVPCSANGRRLRGWDQMEEIADELVKTSGIRKIALLKRLDVKEQKFKTREQRINGEGGSYSFHEPSITIKGNHGRQPDRIIVIDDVYTTGATMHECIKLLQLHFNCIVTGICLAMD